VKHDPCPCVGGSSKTQLDVSRGSNVESARRVLRNDELRSVGQFSCQNQLLLISPRENARFLRGPASAHVEFTKRCLGAGAFDLPTHSSNPPPQATERQVLDQRKVQRQSFALPVFGHESDLRR